MELKFRIFSDGKMFFGGFSIHATAGKVVPDMPWIKESDPVTQFSGLQTEGGRDIYDGDIISFGPWHDDKTTLCLHEVYRENAMFLTREINNSCGNMDGFQLDNSGEVIGNIHENPELLKS